MPHPFKPNGCDIQEPTKVIKSPEVHPVQGRTRPQASNKVGGVDRAYPMTGTHLEESLAICLRRDG